MGTLLEKLWNEYFAEECAAIDTDEESALSKRALASHKAVMELLSKEQNEAVEEYIDALLEIEAAFVKKAFFKGCEFATAFFLEAGNFKKA